VRYGAIAVGDHTTNCNGGVHDRCKKGNCARLIPLLLCLWLHKSSAKEQLGEGGSKQNHLGQAQNRVILCHFCSPSKARGGVFFFFFFCLVIFVWQ